MILHIATFTWKDEVTESDVADLAAALAEMAAQISEIRSYTAGPNLHLRPGGKDFGVAALVATGADLDAYLDHPLHQAVYEKYLGWMLADRAAVQLSVTGDELP